MKSKYAALMAILYILMLCVAYMNPEEAKATITDISVDSKNVITYGHSQFEPVTTIIDIEDLMPDYEFDTDETVEMAEWESGRQEYVTTKLYSGVRITHYCNCSICCGKWAGGKTASGTYPVAGRTIAADTSIFPMGSQVIINGHTYTVEDTGSGIYGLCIDIYVDSHSEALARGLYYTDVEYIY